MIVWGRLADLVNAHGAAALVSVHRVQGSAPREAGARMVVRPDGAFHGSIGGGQLEWQMLALAREALAGRSRSARFLDQTLGPDLGQCCGGRVSVLIETFVAADGETLRSLADREREGPFILACSIEHGRVRRVASDPSAARDRAAHDRKGGPEWLERHGEDPTTLLLFGAGHVGRALALALAPLPFALRWIDPRAEAFPAHVPANAAAVHAADPVAEIGAATDAAFVLIMTHDHALDLTIADAALRRGFPYVGLIGSDTKRARFARRLKEMGHSAERIRALVCPIGVAGIEGKEPAVIAASTVAQLLQIRENMVRENMEREKVDAAESDVRPIAASLTV